MHSSSHKKHQLRKNVTRMKKIDVGVLRQAFPTFDELSTNGFNFFGLKKFIKCVFQRIMHTAYFICNIPIKSNKGSNEYFL